MYLTPTEFFRRYPHMRGKGKLYGGHCTCRHLMKQLDRVMTAMSRCPRDYTVQNENCDMYVQRMVFVAPR